MTKACWTCLYYNGGYEDDTAFCDEHEYITRKNNYCSDHRYQAIKEEDATPPKGEEA